MIFGYARVSTKDQNLDLQVDSLIEAGCEKIFKEKASGNKKDRPQLELLIDQLREGDILIVYSLDRLGRTVKQLLDLMSKFKANKIQFKSLTEGFFDTTSPMGEAIFQIMAILKNMEVNILKERTRKGLDAARSRGRKGGRPKGTYNKVAASAAANLYINGTPIHEILDTVKISRSTLYEYLRRQNIEISSSRR